MAKVVDVSAPGQQAMAQSKATIGIHCEETIFIEFPGAGKREEFVKDHIDMGKLCQMMCCPACCLFIPWAGATTKMEYYRDPGCGKCPYAVSMNGTKVGKVHDVGCWDNGCMFVCCPILTCGGYVKLMGMDGHDGTEKFTFAKGLFPCWPCVQACAQFCGPIGMGCMAMSACCHYCSGSEFQRITQPVYKGPWKRTDGTDPEQIGNFIITNRFAPVNCCCAAPTPLKFYFKPTTPYGQQLISEDLTVLSLVLAIYRGLPAPCKCFSSADFQMPTGVSCLDLGLGTTVKWFTVTEVMRDSAQ
jgi:hypothetical protein